MNVLCEACGSRTPGGDRANYCTQCGTQLQKPTHEEKVAVMSRLPSKWDCSFNAPPACQALWTVEDWVRYVDNTGYWFLKEPK